MKMYPPQQRVGRYKDKKTVEAVEPVAKPKTVGHFNGLVNHKTKVKIIYNIINGNGTASYNNGKIKNSINIIKKQDSVNEYKTLIVINEYGGKEKKLIAKYEGANAGTGLGQLGNIYSSYVFYGIWSTTDGTEKYPFVLVEQANEYPELMVKPETIPKEVVERGGKVPPESPDNYEEVEKTPGQKIFCSYFNGLINHQTKVHIAYEIKSGSWTASYDDGKMKHPVDVRLRQETILINEYSDIDKKLIAKYQGAIYDKYGGGFYGMWSTTDGTKEYPFVLLDEKSNLKPEEVPKDYVQEMFTSVREWKKGLKKK